MKRVTSFLLALVILLGVGSVGIFPVSAESAFTASDECINILKLEEGFSAKPYWDYAQYTVGFGTFCPPDMVEYYTEHGITEEEAETLLRNHMVNMERDINKLIDKYGLILSQHQFDALVLFSYNCGTGWTYETGGAFHNAIKNGATGNDLIRAFALWCSAGGQIKTFLLRRRLCEANMYLNNVYSRTAPENYCYVLYDANGGTTSPRSQGYDANLTAAPFPVPTYEGYTFQGWFTAKKGGVKVDVLDASTKGITLYAQWADGAGQAPEDTGATTENPVTITVTATDVNLRKGPGTNHTIVGTAQKGQQYTITETASGSGYTWGKFDGGWIALEFTNYEEALKNQTTTPPVTEPPVTEPPATEPPATEPPATEPPATEPPATQPQEPAKITGTINVQEWLRVRSGPGTNYALVEYLKPKQKVEILETKMVGATQWGKISSGWISMDYVILDNPTSGGTSSDTAGTNGTVVLNSGELRIRSGPGTSYSIVGYLRSGDRVTVTQQQNNGSMIWGKIANGWISMDYVKLDSASSGSTGGNSANTESVTGTINVQEWLRVRSGPGTSYAVVEYLKPQVKVTITERRTVGSTVWGKIANGWISLDYVILDSAASGGTSTDTPAQKEIKTIIADCLNVRKGPGTNNTVVGYLYYGSKVEILETATAADGTLWGKIANGWISMDYAK